MAGLAQPLELSRSVCMLHMEGEPELASLLLPACSSPASVILSRRMSVAMDCSRMHPLRVYLEICIHDTWVAACTEEAFKHVCSEQGSTTGRDDPDVLDIVL